MVGDIGIKGDRNYKVLEFISSVSEVCKEKIREVIKEMVEVDESSKKDK